MIVDGALYPLRKLERGIKGIAGGYLPTMTASPRGPRKEWNKKGSASAHSIETFASKFPRRGMLPTPIAQEPRRTTVGYGRGLAELIEGKDQIQTKERFPTIRASEYKDSGPIGSKSHNHMAEKDYLCARVKDQTGGQLSPMWTEWFMGYPIGHTELKDWVIQWFRKAVGKRSKY
jgi:hypothetical protein